MDQKQKDEAAEGLAAPGGLTLHGMRQFYINCEREQWKYETLWDLYNLINITQGVIFCNTRRKVDWLAERMTRDDFSVCAIHGDTDASEANRVRNEFRMGGSRYLITTDLQPCGIELPYAVMAVVNFDLPRNKENYLHRVGRSGRYGRKGAVFNFVTEDDVGDLRELEEDYNTVIEPIPDNVVDYL
jgi:translation initiation factor 4A